MPSYIILISGVRVSFTRRVREILRHSCTSHKETKTNGKWWDLYSSGKLLSVCW